MRRDELIRLLRAQPFRPFRLKLSNGAVHEIRHPDMAIVTPSAIYIGVAAAGAHTVAAEDIVIVALVHVNEVEYLSPPTPTTAP